MALRRRSSEVPAGLTSVLLPGENLVIAVHMHWASLAEPVASTVGALALALWVDSQLTTSIQAIGTIFWWGFIILVLRLLWEVLQWHHQWFAATENRLLLRYGLITHKVAMMPLTKVTDMSYERTIPGQFLGYGRFIMESAGQDQALRVVNWVPRSDEIYQAICSEIFHIPVPVEPDVDADGDELDAPEDSPDSKGGGGGSGSGGGSSGSGGGAGPTAGNPRQGPDQTGPIRAKPFLPRSNPPDPAYPDVHRVHNPIQDRLDAYSRAVPLSPAEEGESIYESEDIRRRRRGADTGPLPLWPAD